MLHSVDPGATGLQQRPLPDFAEAPTATSDAAADIAVVVGSLGAPQAIRLIVAGLPSWFPAAVVVVQHRTVAAQDVTVYLLQRAAKLEVQPASEHEPLRTGVVYVTPAEGDLVVGACGRFTRRLPAHFARPADALLASVAEAFGPRASAVVLSGTNDDGAAGVIALKRAGGRVIVQDRQSARCYTMPSAAIATGCVDMVLPLDRIAHALVTLVGWPGASSLLRAPLAAWASLD